MTAQISEVVRLVTHFPKPETLAPSRFVFHLRKVGDGYQALAEAVDLRIIVERATSAQALCDGMNCLIAAMELKGVR